MTTLPGPNPAEALRTEAVPILYTNWKGETAVRRIKLYPHSKGPDVGSGLVFESNEYHPTPQWLLFALDVDKGEARSFALSGIKAWSAEAVAAALTASSTDVEGLRAKVFDLIHNGARRGQATETTAFEVTELLRTHAPRPAASDRGGEALGWLFHNPDTGTEWSENHPVESGECDDAMCVRPATAIALKEELVATWERAEEREAYLAREIQLARRPLIPAPAVGQDGLREAATSELIAATRDLLDSSLEHPIGDEYAEHPDDHDKRPGDSLGKRLYRSRWLLRDRVRKALAALAPAARPAPEGSVATDWRITAAKVCEALAAEWSADGKAYAKTIAAAILAAPSAPEPDDGSALREGDGFPHTVESSRAWMDSAMQFSRNADFYRGLVVQIGEMFGDAAKTSDDGSLQQDVLALKVPELVRAALARSASPPVQPRAEGSDITIERIGKDRRGVTVRFGESEWDAEAIRWEEPLPGMVVALDVDGSILHIDIEDLKADMVPPAEGSAPGVGGATEALREIANLSPEPDDKDWRNEWMEPAGYRFFDVTGQVHETGVDISNNGDIESWAHEKGLHAAAVIARKALAALEAPPAEGAGPDDVSPPEALYAWLLRHYEETNPTTGEGFRPEARPLASALADFIEREMPTPPLPASGGVP